MDDNNSIEPTEFLAFRKSPIHGIGAFAIQDIQRETPVIEYLGERIDKRESLRRCEAENEYIFALDSGHDIDGSVERNLARFINHSCSPNCSAEFAEARIWIVASRDIKAGEELTINYNYDLDDYKQHPCSCGASNCVGYMVAEEFFPHVNRQRELAPACKGGGP